MAEPETQTEDETVTSEFFGEVQTVTTDTDYKSTDYESQTNEDIRNRSLMDEEKTGEMKS